MSSADLAETADLAESADLAETKLVKQQLRNY